MLIASLGKTFPQRKMEWILAGMTASWGGYVLTHPEMFTQPGSRETFAGLASMIPAGMEPSALWGGVAFTVGALRAVALYINGAHRRTPIIRLACAFVTMFVFTQVSFGFYRTGLANTALVIYPWLVAADLLSAYAAGKDAILAEYAHKSERGTLNDGSRFSRSLARL